MTPNTLDRPFSQSCDNNKDPILGVLRRCFARATEVLEIGSGTGQHAAYFGKHLTHLRWQTSDLPENHAAINAWIDDEALTNVSPPLALDVDIQPWPDKQYDAIFSANTLHIMSWMQVEKLFSALKDVMLPGAVLAIYGPFNYEGKFTSPSNRRFDLWLKEQSSLRGIRDYEAVQALAREIGLKRLEDNAMPANNRLLVWEMTG